MSAPAAPAMGARRIWAIVPAAGRGERFGTAHPKQYAALQGATVIEWTLRVLLAETRIDGVLVMVSTGDTHWPAIAARIAHPKLRTGFGAATRRDTVLNGLELLANEVQADDWALVHDAARPCLSGRDLGALLDALPSGASLPAAARGALLAAPVVDTVKRQRDGVVETVDRQGLWRALTPQVFQFAALRSSLEDARRAGVAITDEAAAIERMGGHAILVAGSPFNIKVTHAEDLQVAAGILNTTESRSMRIGQGFDVHTFGPGDHVVLGGVRIDFSRGIVAHSDGDVVIHVQHAEERVFYALERLWKDCPAIPFVDSALAQRNAAAE